MKFGVRQQAEVNKNKLKLLRTALCALLFALNVPADAQDTKKIPRIGYLSASSASEASHRTEAFRQGLREVGHTENKNLIFEWRYAEEKFDRLPGLAAELVGLKVDAIEQSPERQDVLGGYRILDSERSGLC